MAATNASAEEMRSKFILSTVDLDGVSVEREDGHIVATRDLTDDEISMGDIIDLAGTYDLTVGDMQVSLPDGEARVIVGGEE